MDVMSTGEGPLSKKVPLFESYSPADIMSIFVSWGRPHNFPMNQKRERSKTVPFCTSLSLISDNYTAVTGIQTADSLCINDDDLFDIQLVFQHLF